MRCVRHDIIHRMSESTEHSWQSWAEFLADAPPSSQYRGTDIVEITPSNYAHLATPEIKTYCGGECEDIRYFDSCGGSASFDRDSFSCFLTYKCRHCEQDRRYMPLLGFRGDGAWDETSVIVKIGQFPPFGPYTSARLLRLIQPDAELFKKGRRAEAHGLGIGAYSYYRRVVERQKNRLLDGIIAVGKLYSAPADVIAKLEAAKGQHQFKQAMDDVKDAIPDVLKIDGHNPLMLLHRATSKGIHEMEDDECLARAHDVRLVLIALAERISAVTKSDAELKSAVGRLSNLS